MKTLNIYFEYFIDVLTPDFVQWSGRSEWVTWGSCIL